MKIKNVLYMILFGIITTSCSYIPMDYPTVYYPDIDYSTPTYTNKYIYIPNNKYNYYNGIYDGYYNGVYDGYHNGVYDGYYNGYYNGILREKKDNYIKKVQKNRIWNNILK